MLHVTLYKRFLTCFIIYRNALLTFLTLFCNKFYDKKILKIEKMMRDCKNVQADDKTKCKIDAGGRGIGASG